MKTVELEKDKILLYWRYLFIISIYLHVVHDWADLSTEKEIIIESVGI